MTMNSSLQFGAIPRFIPNPPNLKLEVKHHARAIGVFGGCILIFSRSLAAYAEGSPANRNGLTGQFCAACHRTNPLNSGEGSVRIVGLPSAWAPGESYTLRVVVSHPTAIRWGFEFSATG